LFTNVLDLSLDPIPIVLAIQNRSLPARGPVGCWAVDNAASARFASDSADCDADAGGSVCADSTTKRSQSFLLDECEPNKPKERNMGCLSGATIVAMRAKHSTGLITRWVTLPFCT
jgi:hypothetical protein